MGMYAEHDVKENLLGDDVISTWEDVTKCLLGITLPNVCSRCEARKRQRNKNIKL